MWLTMWWRRARAPTYSVVRHKQPKYFKSYTFTFLQNFYCIEQWYIFMTIPNSGKAATPAVFLHTSRWRRSSRLLGEVLAWTSYRERTEISKAFRVVNKSLRSGIFTIANRQTQCASLTCRRSVSAVLAQAPCSSLSKFRGVFAYLCRLAG